MFCPRCGKENDDTARYCQACGNGLQPAVTPSPATGVARYAAFWERFVAQVIDAVILSVATGTVFTATFGAGMAIGFFAPWLYEAFMTGSEWQATVGKRVMSIVVTDLNGNRMSFARATGRHFGIFARHRIRYCRVHGKKAGPSRHDRRDSRHETLALRLALDLLLSPLLRLRAVA